MFVHHTRNVLRNPNFAYQLHCLFSYPAMSILNVDLDFRPNSVTERA